MKISGVPDNFRQFRNWDIYSALNQAAGMPYQDRPQPIVTNSSSPVKKHKNKTVLTIVLVVGAAFLIHRGFLKKGVKAL